MKHGDSEKAEAKEILSRQAAMETERQTTESTWQECLDYIVPRKAEITTQKTPGDKRGHDLFDSTAINSNQLLAAALHGMLTNPSTRFFELVFDDAEMMEDEEVLGWLQDSADRMFVVLNNSNFQTEVHEIYIDLGGIGNAAMWTAEHDEKIVHFSARAMKEIFIRENNLGLVDTVHRKFKWKPRQVVQEFGIENLPEKVVNDYKKGCDDDWTIIHAVEPGSDEKMKVKKHSFISRYILQEESMLLSRGGFREFPYAVPRWTKTSGEVYGRGPGHDMLPDIKMVNKMMETTLKGAQKTVDPPLMVADDSVIGNVRLTPSGVTVVRPMTEVPIRPLITDARIDFGYQAVEDVRKRIRSGFYVDQLQLNEGPQMTAAEVFQRTEEKLRLMGPVLGRQHFEFLRPVIERVFAIMYRRGLIRPAPKKIQGKKFDVRYSSLVARAQRMSDGQNLTRALSVAAPILQVKPESIDLLNGDKALKHILDIYGITHRILNNAGEVQKIRDARSEANAKLAEQAQQKHESEVVRDVAPGAAKMMEATQE